MSGDGRRGRREPNLVPMLGVRKWNAARRLTGEQYEESDHRLCISQCLAGASHSSATPGRWRRWRLRYLQVCRDGHDRRPDLLVSSHELGWNWMHHVVLTRLGYVVYADFRALYLRRFRVRSVNSLRSSWLLMAFSTACTEVPRDDVLVSSDPDASITYGHHWVLGATNPSLSPRISARARAVTVFRAATRKRRSA